MTTRFTKVGASIIAATIALGAPAFAQNTMVGGAEMFPNRNIVENAVNSADHTTLVAAVQAAGLAETLSGPGQNFPLESIYRDAKIGEIYEGANEIQNWVIARHIFGREMTG